MTTIYVTKTGNDSTGDGTSGNPYLTITKAITMAVNGDSISIGDGTYSESLNVNKGLTIFSANEDKTLVTITSSVVTITIPHSTNNVTLRNLTVVTTSTTVEAITVAINKDFILNPSGLPILSSICNNIVIQGCQITFNKTAVTINAKDSVIKQCSFSQVGAASSYTVFLVYSIDGLSILENTHTVATANMNRFIYMATSGAGDYRSGEFIVKSNTVNIGTVAPGHFILQELVLIPPSGPLTLDVQNNVFTTTQASTGGLVILFPSSATVLQNTLSTTNLGVIANNQVINPYRGWLYVDITASTPSPMGSTYFNIYGNTFTGTLSQRPLSYDVDGQQNVLVSTTPASTTGWAAIYNTTPKTYTLPAPTSEQEASDILQEALLEHYPGENLVVPLSLFSINNVDDPTLLNPIIHQSSTPLSDTDSGTLQVIVTNPQPTFRYMFQVLDTPYKTEDSLSFVIKVYNNLTNELVTSSINANLEFVLGGANAGKTFKLFRYVHPNYTDLGPLVESSTPGTYTFTLDTNSLYSIQLQSSPPVVASDNSWWVWFILAALVAGVVLYNTRKRPQTPAQKR